MASASSSQYQRLNKSTAPQSAMILDSTPATGIVHIGLGNFHRAHLALYTAMAVKDSGGDWGIFAYSLRSTTIADAMSSQDQLYSIVTISPTSQKIVVPGIHSAALVDALRPAAAQKNPAFKGSTLYTIFEARRAAPCS